MERQFSMLVIVCYYLDCRPLVFLLLKNHTISINIQIDNWQITLIMLLAQIKQQTGNQSLANVYNSEYSQTIKQITNNLLLDRRIFFQSIILVYSFTKKNHISMSVIASTPEEICNAPYNNSTAKMQYSFSKDKRFKDNKQNADRPYYNISLKISKRSTTFGYGTKYDFTRDMPKSPPPTCYQAASPFDQNKVHKKGFGFGNSRQNMVITGPLAQTINNKNPGPGSYEIPTTKSRCYYSIKGKRKQPQIQNTPGPGNYEIKPTLNNTGSNFFSRYRDHHGAKLTSSTQRFRTVTLDYPGPGKYDSSTVQINPQGKYSLSKIQNSKVRSFGSAKRKSLNQNTQTPGPGNYQLPSDFGYYVNRKFYTKEKSKLMVKEPSSNSEQSKPIQIR